MREDSHKLGTVVNFVTNPAIKGMVFATGADDRGPFYWLAYFDNNGIRHEDSVREYEIVAIEKK